MLCLAKRRFYLKERSDLNAKKIKFTLTGVPNVGKSTLFNTLTGARVHTGNWSGKTVSTSVGQFSFGGVDYTVEDLPGAYSLAPRSEEEAVALEALTFTDYDVCVIVCDESRFYSNFNFLLQALDAVKSAVVCLNFCESAEREGVKINADLLSKKLGVEVVRVNARKKRSLQMLLSAVRKAACSKGRAPACTYAAELEESLGKISEFAEKFNTLPINTRIIALQALLGNRDAAEKFCNVCDLRQTEKSEFLNIIYQESKRLFEKGFSGDVLCEMAADAVCLRAEKIYGEIAVSSDAPRRLGVADRILTGKFSAYPAMLLFLGVVLLITVKLSSYPSEWLGRLFDFLIFHIRDAFIKVGVPAFLTGVICDGALGTLFTVTAVMLPPMAIFFPFFTLLEDSGYLPRVAYNLDRPFAACGACGKQSLTMCMGLGCNAVGVTGARIIDTKRERLLAIVTNSFVPCNGRFPMLIVISATFFAASGLGGAGVILLAVIAAFFVTFAVTFALSHTILKGDGGFFTIELPPYRKPDFFKVLVRSIFDRTLKILGRAAAVAIPAGMIIWCLSNIELGGVAPIYAVVDFLDPPGRLMGLDGVMLTSFILGLPANETVLPIALSLYGTLGSTPQILAAAGWTVKTAVCAMAFTLFHFPCSTTIMTIKKETGSLGWTALAVILPTAVGFIVCTALNAVMSLI